MLIAHQYRTNWYWDKAKINILRLAIAYEGVAIPIFLNLLDKAGNEKAQEHQYIWKKANCRNISGQRICKW